MKIVEEKVDGYNRVVSFSDDDFTCFIALHNLNLGPALGGCRIKNYADADAAKLDALRLAKGMTYKSSLAGLNLGGGKCHVANTRIAMADGSYKMIQDIVIGDAVICIDEKNKIQTRKVLNTFKLPSKPVIEIETRRGLKVKCSETHKLLSDNGWKETRNLKINDFLATARNTIFGNNTFDKDKIKVLGYMLGDGRIGDRGIQISFTAFNDEIREDFCQSIEEMNCTTSYKLSKSILSIKSKDLPSKYGNSVREFFYEMGLLGKTSSNKFIPDFIFKLDEEHLSLFLRCLYATDGWASVSKKPNQRSEVGYCTTSQIMANQIIELLSKYGICARKYAKKGSYKDNSGNSVKCLTAYNVIIKDKDHVKIFIDRIGIYGKSGACENVAEFLKNATESGGMDCIPKSLVHKALESTNKVKGRSQLWDRLNRPYYKTVRREFLQRASKTFASLVDISTNDLYWDQITSITRQGIEDMYDFEVDEFHNYISNGVISHNCVVMAERSTRDIMLKVGEAVNYFNGDYITAEDMGTSLSDIGIVGEVSPHIVRIDGSSLTAKGVYVCMQAALKHLGMNRIDDIPIWIQGLGKVGYDLVERLSIHQTYINNLYVNDIRPEIVLQAIEAFGVHEIIEFDKSTVGIYAPCAMGQVVNADNFRDLRYPIICGSANNQLVNDEYAEMLMDNDVLYCTDWLVNAGGVICAACEVDSEDGLYHEDKAEAMVEYLGVRLTEVLETAESENKTPLAVSINLAESRFLNS